MTLATRHKVQIATGISNVLRAALALAGRPPEVVVRRDGIRWALDLREGIDLAIFLGVYERSTVAAYRRYLPAGGVALDVGANCGYHALTLARLVGPEGRVIAAEPTGSAFRRLMANLALNRDLGARVSPRQAVITDGDAHPVPSALYSSWSLGKTEGAHPLHCGILHDTTGAESVSLDRLVSEAGLTRLDLIKIDVDGHEHHVVRGAQETLATFSPHVVMELAAHVFDDPEVALGEITSVFERLGYTGQLIGTGRPVPLDVAALRSLCVGGRSHNLLLRKRDLERK